MDHLFRNAACAVIFTSAKTTTASVESVAHYSGRSRILLEARCDARRGNECINQRFPLLTALLGYLTSAFTEYFRDRRARERDRSAAAAMGVREREARQAARRMQLFERRSNFQRETLLNLQDAVTQLARAAGRMHHMDEMEYRKTGQWGGHLLPEDLDVISHEAMVKTLMFMVRVSDDRIREMMSTFRHHAAHVGICRTQRESQQAFDGMSAALGPLHERIGMILRKLDDEEAIIESEP